MPKLGSYNPDEIVVAVGGAILDGWADGAFVTIANEANAFEYVTGTTGEVVRSKAFNRAALITVTLMQSSDSNDLLTALARADREGPNGAGIFSLAIRDAGTGRMIYTAAQAWIEKEPDVTFDRTATSRAWAIRCANLDRVDGGSS